MNTASVDFSGAPSTLVIYGSNDPSNTITDNVLIDVEVVVPVSGTWSFKWAYHTNDVDMKPLYDVAYVLINGFPIELSNSDGAVDQSGTYSTAVAAGDVIGFRIDAIDNGYGDAVLTITDFSAPGSGEALPVVFSRFDAQKFAASVQLNWGTSAEIQNDRFEIERSVDGRNFATIGKVKGNGSTSQANNYSFIDYTPASGINYYRLCQVDIDGQRHYTRIVTVNMGTETTVFPNPVRSGLLTLIIDERGASQVSLYGANGNLIEVRKLPSEKSPVRMTWDVSNLRPGIYFFRTDAGTAPIRFVKI